MELSFPDPPLRDEVVALRPFREADVPAIVENFRDPDVHRDIWPRPEAYRETDALEFLARQGPARSAGTDIGFAVVEPRDEGIVLGGVGLNEVDWEQRRARVGYWVAAGARRRGVASHAVRLVAGWALERLGLARLEITCGPDNVASQRVAESCGFVREGLLRSHVERKGERRDSIMFGLLPGELRE